MKFINRIGKKIKVRTGKRFNHSWITVKPGETIDLPRSKGKRYGLESYQESPIVTEGKIGKKKVETKQFEHDSYVGGLKDGIQAERDGVVYTPDDLFFKELTKIKGIGNKTATDIVEWGTKEKLIEQIKLKMHLPFRDDVAAKLIRKYDK